MAEIIKATGERIAVTPKNGTDFSLDELRGVVGGCIEIVPLPGIGYMVVNDEGHRLGLPFNPLATAIYVAYPIMGDVLICSIWQIR